MLSFKVYSVYFNSLLMKMKRVSSLSLFQLLVRVSQINISNVK